jgi:serine/threonine-protein kinase
VATTLSDPLLGRVVDGRYEVVRRIARGGMATVYVARDRRLDRDVALKVMHPHLAEGASGAEFVARFRREARAAARLTHPGLVGVFDQGVDGETSYLTMELVEGTNLRRRIAEQGALTVRESLRIVEDVLDALTVAHHVGLVHRDIKPENVLLGPKDRIKVADFGLARAVTEVTATTTGTILGTVAYLAPELMAHGRADTRTDVYAAGILLFEMLTGTQPFTGATPIQVAYQHVNSDMPAPSDRLPWLPVEVDELVGALAARDPDDRPRDATAALALVRRTRDVLDDATLDRRADVPAGAPATATAGAAGAAGAAPTTDGDAPTAVIRPDDEPATEVLDRAALDRAALDHAGLAGVPHPGEPQLSDPGAPTPGPAPDGDPDTSDDGEVADPPAAADAQATERFVIAAPTAPHRASGEGAVADSPRSGDGDDPEEQQSRTIALPIGSGLRPPEPPRRRRRWPWLVVATLLVAGLGVGLWWYQTDGPGAWTRVPVGVVQVDLQRAEALLTARGLDTGDTTEDFSPTVPAGQVISASPGEGERIRKDASVDLVVSKGQDMRTVPPDLAGKPVADVVAALEAAGFTVPEPLHGYSDQVPQGVVISITKEAGEQLPVGSEVAVRVSDGFAPVTVPSVLGSTQDDAKRTLEQLGLVVELAPDYSETYAAGQVMVQSLDPSTQAHRRDKVVLTISQGPPLVAVPNVRGYDEARAKKEITDAGLAVKVEYTLFGHLAGSRVVGQTPEGGQPLPKGSEVTITIG